MDVRYVIVTAAYNEAGNIGRLIQSVSRQTVTPVSWIIVADGCTDATAEIVRRFAGQVPFLELLEISRGSRHDFASKVRAFSSGVERLRNTAFEFIGNIDADISLERDYFAELLTKFELNPKLGIGGGAIAEWDGQTFRPRRTNTTTDVAGAVQLFRRECYEIIGGFLPLKYGGEDWHAQVSALMAGWEAATFPEILAYHHDPPKGIGGALRRGYRQGRMDFTIGSHVGFELARLVRRLKSRVSPLECAARLYGFLMGYCTHEQRPVPREFVEFLRSREREKLRHYLGAQMWKRPTP